MTQEMIGSARFSGHSPAQTAASIAKLAQQEALALARVELERFMALVETLTPADLSQPTERIHGSVQPFTRPGLHGQGYECA